MKKRILIVDDEKDMLDIMEAILTVGGYSVLKASSGRDAIAMADKEHPDLIILDIKMPNMDGVATTDVLKNHRATSEIPIIYLSNLVGEDEVEDGHVPGSKIGDIHFIPKSYSPEELLAIVRKKLQP
ncbi:MAG: response regulator [Candidatus Omnitrophota bacterium]|nr:MAG: response regulator [Candidatus Omnitrophota bacterium]